MNVTPQRFGLLGVTIALLQLKGDVSQSDGRDPDFFNLLQVSGRRLKFRLESRRSRVASDLKNLAQVQVQTSSHVTVMKEG